MEKTYVITANVNGLLKMFYIFEQKIRPRPVHAFQLRACCPMSSKIKEVGKKRGKDIFASPSSLRTYYFTLLHKLDQFQMILTIIWAFDHLPEAEAFVVSTLLFLSSTDFGFLFGSEKRRERASNQNGFGAVHRRLDGLHPAHHVLGRGLKEDCQVGASSWSCQVTIQ